MIDIILDNMMKVSASLILLGIAGVCIRIAHVIWFD